MAPSPSFTGATSTELEPMEAPAPISVRDLLKLTTAFDATIGHEPHQRHADIHGEGEPRLGKRQSDSEAVKERRDLALHIRAQGGAKHGVLAFGAGLAIGAMMSGGCCGWGYSSWSCNWYGGGAYYHGGAYYGNAAWHGGYYGHGGYYQKTHGHGVGR